LRLNVGKVVLSIEDEAKLRDIVDGLSAQLVAALGASDPQQAALTVAHVMRLEAVDHPAVSRLQAYANERVLSLLTRSLHEASTHAQAARFDRAAATLAELRAFFAALREHDAGKLVDLAELEARAAQVEAGAERRKQELERQQALEVSQLSLKIAFIFILRVVPKHVIV